MKKSEALKILGLADGATDDEVKQAHRKLVIAHHPDKFALDSDERAHAEELTKRINEARDVLLDRSWTPEFDPRRDPRPYANPYAHPSDWPFPGGASAGGVGGVGRGGARGHGQGKGGTDDPFAGWPFGGRPGDARTTWVWTSWDGGRTYEGGSQAGPGAPFDPFDPFAPFRRAEPEPTREEALAAAARDLRREALVIAGKAALLAVMTIGGAVSSGLFLYVAVSFVYGLWKRLGTCLFGFLVPAMVVLALLSLFVAPRGGVVTVGLALVFMIAAAFDVANLRTRFNAWRAARRRAR